MFTSKRDMHIGCKIIVRRRCTSPGSNLAIREVANEKAIHRLGTGGKNGEPGTNWLYWSGNQILTRAGAGTCWLDQPPMIVPDVILERAVEHIRAEAGKHFDPAIVEAFLNMLARQA